MWKWLTLGSFSFAALYFLKRQFSGGICVCKERLDGKIIIITGANSGIGKEASYFLAKKGATVILACRNKIEGQCVAEEICNSKGNLSIKCEYLDLTSFKSIQSFVQLLKDTGVTNVYALINNAGVFYHPFKLTENGFEVTFQTNYLGPFYLTLLLLNNSLLSGPSRIINVASEAHRLPKCLDVNKVSKPRPEINQFTRYGESKLCIVLFTAKLASLLKDVSVFSVDPGNVETNVYRHFPLLNNWILFALQKPLRWILVKTPKQGAQTVVHATVHPSIFSGSYFCDCVIKKPSKLALDKKLADDLWNKSLNLCDLTLLVENSHVHETSKPNLVFS